MQWLVGTLTAGPNLAPDAPPDGLLGPAEAAQLARLRGPQRRQAWLLGRWTAKQLLQADIWERRRVAVPAAALQVLNGWSQAPFVSCRWPLAGWQWPAISISHSQDRAFCAIGPGQRPLGVDIEWIAPRSAAFVADYYTTTEQAAVVAAPSAARDLLVTAIWSAKEAVLKYLRRGLTLDTRCCTCLMAEGADPEGRPSSWTPSSWTPSSWTPSSWTPFTIRGHADGLAEALAAARGWWQVRDGFVLTIVA